jgi:cell division protein ZapA
MKMNQYALICGKNKNSKVENIRIFRSGAHLFVKMMIPNFYIMKRDENEIERERDMITLDSLDQKIENLKGKIWRIKHLNTTLTDENAALCSSLEEKENYAAKLISEKNQTDHDNSKLLQERKELEDKNSALEVDIARKKNLLEIADSYYKRKISKLQDSKNELEKEIEKLKSDINSRKTAEEKSQKFIQRLQLEHSNCRAKLDEAKLKLEKKLSKKEAELEKVLHEQKKLNADLDTAKIEVKRKDMELEATLKAQEKLKSALGKEKDENGRKIRNLDSELEESLKMQGKLKADLEKAKNANTRKCSELERSRINQGKLQADLEKSKIENNNLEELRLEQEAKLQKHLSDAAYDIQHFKKMAELERENYEMTVVELNHVKEANSLLENKLLHESEAAHAKMIEDILKQKQECEDELKRELDITRQKLLETEQSLAAANQEILKFKIWS